MEKAGKIDGEIPETSSGRPRRPRTTIYDIAQKAEASIATVSMVLNDKWRKHRIRAETAEHILAIAKELGFSANMRARALRLDRSGLAGMIIPIYEDRFCSGLAEAFQAEAYQRKLCPVVVSTRRDEALEVQMVKNLLSHQVEFLFIAGSSNPAVLNTLCQNRYVPCVNIDLPAPSAPSVVADNRAGARVLANKILNRLLYEPGNPAARIFFIGGVEGEYATRERVLGFCAALEEFGMEASPEQIILCGYEQAAAEAQIKALYMKFGRLPAGLLINSVTAFEGAVQFFTTLNRQEFEKSSIGCFDWDPLALLLPFPILMVRQDAKAMISKAFSLIEREITAPPFPFLIVPTHFVET